MRASASPESSDSEVGINILLLEDNLADAKLVTRRLRGVYEVMQVTKLADAVVESGPFAAILLDLGLPDADGLEAVTALRSRFSEAAIVVLTGLDDDRVAHEAVREGAQDYLVKDDVSSASLVRSIRYAIERKTTEVLRNRLYHSDRLASVGQLAAGVAHEINNPSAFLLNNAEHGINLVDELTQCVLAAGINEEATKAKLLNRLQDLREMFGDNLQGIQRIQSVVSELSTFSRIEEGDIESLQLNDLINVACNLTRNEVRHRAEMRLSLGELPHFPGHRGRITQVLVNLIISP
jgi:PleD family two-component response regulator